MTIVKKLTTLLSVAMVVSISFSTNAHRAWIKPSATHLSGEAPWVTFDAAVSNTLFVPEHVPMRLKGLQVIDPEGNKIDIANEHTSKYRSTFDLNLHSSGTYKVGYEFGGLRATWKDKNGKRKMWPGRGKTADDAEFFTAVPKNADSLKVSRSYWRLETFVTAGEPNKKVFEPSNSGLELVPVTHPNDLFVGEVAQFKFLFQGKPAANTKISIVAGHMRYRNKQNQLDFVTDAKGYVSINWPEAGMYLLEAKFEDAHAKAPATKRSGRYGATFEVLPQ